MNRSVIIEAVALYWPIVVGLALYYAQRSSNMNLRRYLIAGLMASVWVAATLPWVNDLCVCWGSWNFEVHHEFRLQSLPASLYFSWVVLWGMIPALLMYFVRMRWIIVAMLLLDVLTMGTFEPVMQLNENPQSWYEHWLIGEFFVMLVCLMPAVCLAKLVIKQQSVGWRAFLVSAGFVMLLLVVLPINLSLVRIDLVGVWLGYHWLERWLWIFLLLFVSLPGIAGVMEFAKVGKGTPIPYDPPTELVTTGVYGYIKNPIQLSMVLVSLVWALIFSSWLMVAIATVAVVYSCGVARWSEDVDLCRRFGQPWRVYTSEISAWKMRLVPLWLGDTEATVYFDSDCSICRSVAEWIKKMNPVGLTLKPASSWEGAPLERMTYHDPSHDHTLSGVLAMGKILQHIHLAWAWLGWFISLPILSRMIQYAMDASGAGKQSGTS